METFNRGKIPKLFLHYLFLTNFFISLFGLGFGLMLVQLTVTVYLAVGVVSLSALYSIASTFCVYYAYQRHNQRTIKLSVALRAFLRGE